MLLPRWLHQLAQRWSLRSGKRRRRAGRVSARMPRRVRPRLEGLEDRLTPSTLDSLVFSIGGNTYSGTVAPNQASGAISVQLQDSSGHAITAAGDVTVKLSSSSSTGDFLDLSGKALANNSIVIPTGSSYALFEYEDSQTGQATIKGLSTSPFAFGGMYMNVNDDRLAFTTAPQTLAPGEASQPITVQLQDANGNAVKATSDVTVSLIGPPTGQFLDTSGNPLPMSPSGEYTTTIAAGSSSASFEFEDSQVEQFQPFITATAGTGASASQSVTVQYDLGFTTPVQVAAANQLTGAITVQLQDASGNAVKAANAVTLYLSSTSFTGQFFDTSGNALANNSITVAAGSSSASFEYKDSTSTIATISASTSIFGGTSAQQSVYVGQPLAIVTPAQTLTPGKASQPITVQLQTAATSNETIVLSSTSSTGQFLDTSGNVLANNSIPIAAGSSSASFEYEDSTIGLPTITATSSALGGSATQQESVGVSLNFTTPPQTVAQGQKSGTITVQLQDSSGKPFLAANDTSVSLSSTNFGQFFDTSGNPIFSLTIAPGTSSGSFEYESPSSSGVQTVTASITPIGNGVALSATQQETVTSPPFNTVAFVSPVQTIAAGQTSQPITIQLQTNGGVYTAPSAVTITLSSSSSTGKFLDTSGNPLTNNTITIAAGSSMASFEYEDSTEWFPMLTATVSGSTIAGTQSENVGGVTLAFSTSAQTITAGQPSANMTVQFQDSSGQAVTNQSVYDAFVSLLSNSSTAQFLDTTGKPLTGNAVSIAAGANSASFEYEDTVGGKPTLTASSYAAGYLSATQQETVTGPYTLQFTTSARSIATKQASQPITVQLVDSTGATATATSAVTVNLSSSSGGGKLLDTSGNALANNSITIAAGSSTASFEYEDSTTGFATLTASENGLSSTQQEAVGLKLAFTTSAQTLTAGQNSQVLTVQLQDSSGNAFAAPNAINLSLFGNFSSNNQFFSSSPGVQFLDTSGNPLPPFSPITIAKGSSSASFEFKSQWGGTLNVSAECYGNGSSFSSTTGFLSASQQETVNGLSALVFTTSAQTLTAGQTSGTVTLQLEDNTGKPANAPTNGLTIDLSAGSPYAGSPSTKFFDTNGNLLPTNQFNIASITLPAGSSTVSFQFQSTQAGSMSLNAQVANGFSVQQTETIQVGAPSTVAFLTGPQSLAAGVPSGSITVQLQDKYGNAITGGSGGALTFNLSSSSNTGKFLSVSGDPLAGSSITLPLGATSATFEYEDSQSGTPTLTATASGISGTQQETVAATSAEIHVTNTNDSGTGSLRAAIEAANANPGSTIVFDSGVTGTIDLQSDLPAIVYNTNIIGPGANVLTIDHSSTAASTFGGFTVGFANSPFAPAEPTVTISGLTVADFDGTGINNYGSLTLRQVDVNNTQALPPSSNPTNFLYNVNLQGGIVNSGTLTVLDSTSADNAYSGIYSAFSSTFGTNLSVAAGLTIINSTITGNTGGGITSLGTSYIASSTISGNTDTNVLEGLGSLSSSLNGFAIAGGITSSGAMLYDTIVAGNTGPTNGPNDVSGSFFSLGHNLIGQADSKTSSGFVSTDQVGTTTSPIDPKLGTLTNNGGPTPTMVLLSGSPAIAAGSSANAPAHDQRGDPRPTSGAIDIGAYEATAVSTGTAPSITGQPSNVTVTAGQTASFTASASGSPTPAVQWQVSSDGGKTFTNISGATNTTLTLTSVTAAMNGNEYQAVFTNSAGTAITDSAMLIVQVAPTVTTQPTSQTTTVGQNVRFTAAANGNPAPMVQWQVSTDGGKTFTNISGATSTTLTLKSITAAMNGNEYQAVFTNSVSSITTTAATLSVQFAPTVTTNPTDQKVTESSSATFTAAANGNPAATVQWQSSTDGAAWSNLSDGQGVSGSTTGTLTLSNVASSQNNEEFRAVFTNSLGSATTTAATLTVNVTAKPPSITGQPSDETATAGQNATFTASASGSPTPTVQWQVSSDGGKTFTNISGATSTTLTLNHVATAMNGNEYQAVFSNSIGSATTSVATLTVQFPPTITTNPSNQTATTGQNATFTAEANASPAATVQWQVSTDGGKTFTDIRGATSTTLLLTAVTALMNGDEYQAVFTNSLGKAVTTAATLTVDYAPVVTSKPNSQTVTAGQTVTFTAAADANPTATVQWQVSTDGGKTFTNISGAASTTLTLNAVTAAMNGDEYQAVFTNSLGTATTRAATLTVDYAPLVTTAPSSQTVTAGQNVTFTAAANANPTVTVQWQVSTDGGATFTNISGATSTTLALSNVQTSQSGDEYQAVFTNSIGTVTTSAATLTVDYAPAVMTIPKSQTVAAGQTATFTAAASGNPTPSVQWQVSSDGGKTFTNISGATSTTLTLNHVATAMNGNEYQAVFGNSIGSATTSVATLTVQFPPTITTNPSNQTATTGQNATFTAEANGNPTPTVQWQVSGDRGKTWSDLSGATSATLTLSNVLFSQNGNEYRAIFTNSAGSATTTAATLTVQMMPTILSGNNAVFTIGQKGNFTLTATGSPTPTFTESGALPGGITFADNGNGTATLSGVLAAGTQGTYHFTITAHNGVGSGFTQSFTLTANPAPVPPSPPQPPVLNVPPLLSLLDSLLVGIETINANGTETVVHSLFGIALVTATYDGSGNFMSATLLGITLPNWVWSL